jgi:hypothetical protein
LRGRKGMKKILISILMLQMVFLMSCSQVESQSFDSENSENSDDVTMDSEDIDTPKNDDLSIYETLDDVYDFQNKEEVLIRKINEEKLLVGYQEKFAYQMNPMFYIFDVKTEASQPIDGQLEFIDEIRIESNTIDFFSKGTNIINGFKKFPNITKVAIDTGISESTMVYSRLGSDYKPYLMGNFMNETKLEALNIVEEKIIFDFGVSENTILAGGDHCPNIEVMSEKNSILSVDIENLFLNEEEIKALAKEKFINDIKISSYIDGRGISHKVIKFYIDDYTEYTCSFETGNDGIRDLVVIFK